MESNRELGFLRDLPSELQIAILSVLPYDKIEFLVPRIWNEPGISPYTLIIDDYLDQINSSRDELKERAVPGAYEKVDDQFIFEHLQEFLSPKARFDDPLIRPSEEIVDFFKSAVGIISPTEAAPSPTLQELYQEGYLDYLFDPEPVTTKSLLSKLMSIYLNETRASEQAPENIGKPANVINRTYVKPDARILKYFGPEIDQFAAKSAERLSAQGLTGVDQLVIPVIPPNTPFQQEMALIQQANPNATLVPGAQQDINQRLQALQNATTPDRRKEIESKILRILKALKNYYTIPSRQQLERIHLTILDYLFERISDAKNEVILKKVLPKEALMDLAKGIDYQSLFKTSRLLIPPGRRLTLDYESIRNQVDPDNTSLS